MAWECQTCEEKNTFKDIANTVLKVGAVVGLAYVFFTYKDTIKESIDAALKSAKSKQLNGGSKKKKSL